MKLKDIAVKVLQGVSGNSVVMNEKYFIYNKIIGFKGVVDGVGCSTMVASVAMNLAEKGLNVCVIDTSILNPTQHLLLNTEESSEEDRDWLDLGRSDSTGKILKTSGYSSSIVVLNFENRSINELVSTFDTEELVTSAYGMLETLYDIILVDICSETTNITTAAAIHAHTVYQVWSNEFVAMASIDNFLKNMAYRCCHVDKMRNVIINKTTINSNKDWEELIKKYNFNCLTKAPFSLDFYIRQCSGVPLSKMSSTDKTVSSLYKSVEEIVEHILGISAVDGTISAIDIMDGKVAGTTRKKNKDKADKINKMIKEDMSKIPEIERSEESTKEKGSDA